MANPSIDAITFKGAISNCRRSLRWLVLFSLGINLLILTSPIYMMQVFDRVLSSGRLETLLFLTLIAGIAVFAMGLIDMARGQFLVRVGNWLDRSLSAQVIASALALRLNDGVGSVQPLRDLGTLRSTLASPGFVAVIDTPWVPVFILIIWLMHPVLGLIALGSAAALFTVGLLNELTCRAALKKAGQLSIAAIQEVGAALRNAEAVQAMGMQPAIVERYDHSSFQSLGAHQQAADRGAAFIGLSKSLRFFVQILILGAGAWLVLRGELTSGGMIAGSILLGRALAPVEQSIGAWKQLVVARDAWQRLKQLLAEVPPQPDRMPLPEPTGVLECDQLTFVPSGGKRPILRNITFHLDPGEVLGVVGPSAAGKSTLCKVVTGSWKPTRGRTTLDGAEIHSWRSEDLGPHLGYLPQETELFTGTVGENIARLLPEPDSAAVIEAARSAGVHELILSLSAGYDTDIGDGGYFLSGGQRQRIGLARALYGKPKLIVLDEPNANLDPQGEKALLEAILHAKQWGAAVIVVAHHPAILRSTDKIMLMREGKIEALGRRDEIFGRFRAALGSAQPAASRSKDESDPTTQEVRT
ncbi:MAG: type I secretion system permease/ATPase [Alphaproteobacteria bacterium]